MKQELFPEIADSGLRIDKYLSTVNEQLSRSYIQKLLKSGLVLVDGKPVKASYQWKKRGDLLRYPGSVGTGDRTGRYGSGYLI